MTHESGYDEYLRTGTLGVEDDPNEEDQRAEAEARALLEAMDVDVDEEWRLLMESLTRLGVIEPGSDVRQKREIRNEIQEAIDAELAARRRQGSL